MPRQNLNVDMKIGGRKKCKVRKRGRSSSSSSSLAQNHRLKRGFSVGNRVGSTTPAPMWKMKSSASPSLSLENDEAFKFLAAKVGDKAGSFWEINGLSSPRVKSEKFEDKMSDVGIVRNERTLESSKQGSVTLIALSDVVRSPVSERMDPPKVVSHRRRASAVPQEILQADCDVGGPKSPHDYLVEDVQVDQTHNHARSPCRHTTTAKNRLKDVYNGLVTSKELLKVMTRLCHFEQQNPTSLSLYSALKFELDRACAHVSKLIQQQRSSQSEIEILFKHFEEEKAVWKMKEHGRIRNAISLVAGELDAEKKLRRQTERLNKKLGRELAETKASLSDTTKELESEKRAREILEQVCDELARGMGEDRAEVEKLKRQSAKAREEVEKEREMLQLADVLREERVQMKLSEAKYQFEEKTALVDKLRKELEFYLKSKMGEEQPGGSPNHDKIKELEEYLRETLPDSYQYQHKEDVEAVNEEEEEDGNDSANSDLHSIELNMDNINKSFQWSDAVRNESKRNAVDKSKWRKSISENIKQPTISSETNLNLTDGIQWEFITNKQENLVVFDRRGMLESASLPQKDTEDEIERYNMIKDLRDRIVSSSRIGSSPDLASPSQSLGQQSVSLKDPNGVACQG